MGRWLPQVPARGCARPRGLPLQTPALAGEQAAAPAELAAERQSGALWGAAGVGSAAAGGLLPGRVGKDPHTAATLQTAPRRTAGTCAGVQSDRVGPCVDAHVNSRGMPRAIIVVNSTAVQATMLPCMHVDMRRFKGLLTNRN